MCGATFAATATASPRPRHVVDDLVDDVVELLDELEVQRAHFVGLSLGGMTGVRPAALSPELVDRPAVLCAPALLGPSQAWHNCAAMLRQEGTSTVVGRWHTTPFAASVAARVLAARQLAAATPTEGCASRCEAIATMDLTEELVNVAVPILAIAGAEDPATSAYHLERVASGVRDGRPLGVPKAPHLANDEQPQAVTRVLPKHLTGDHHNVRVATRHTSGRVR